MGDKIEIEENSTTRINHELLTLHIGKDDSELVDLCKTEDGELLSVTVGSTEITPEIWDILCFLKKEGKLEAP